MAIIFKDSKKQKKVALDHNYGGFWMGKGDANVEYEGRSGASSVVKALKLRNYQRAIGNFVKILSHKDVPVVFKGTDSYTDGKSIVVIAADVSDKNFDVTAGLALHEASHIKHTDFGVLKNLMKEDLGHGTKMNYKQMLNWIEDRRIDTIVFKNCPGYKAYYHKLYDKYFRSKEMSQMLDSKKYRTETYENYEAHIIGMMNDSFNTNALEILPQVTALIDVNNISRLKDTADALDLAKEVVDLIEAHIAVKKQEEQESKEQEEQQGPAGSQDNEEEEKSEEKSEDGEGDGSDDGEGGEGEDSEDNGGGAGLEGEDTTEEEEEEEEEANELTPKEQREVEKALDQAKEMLAGNVYKKDASKTVQKQLGQLQNAEVDFTGVGGAGNKMDCLIYRLDKETSKISQMYTMLAAHNAFKAKPNMGHRHEDYDAYLTNRQALQALVQKLPVGLSNIGKYDSNAEYAEVVAQGLQLGSILGKKLMTRRESRELVTNRLRTGKIDTKRIAHAGYGIENIFNQISIDSYNKANIHLTIDASGSMNGHRWKSSLKMAAAIGKAVSMIEGLELQVSMRETSSNGNNPAITFVYDSRTNKLNHLKMLLELYNCNSMTPEGLCLEAMIKKNLFVKGHSEMDSYMINICDGAPGMSGYGGHSAIQHTRQQVKKLNNELGINHIGFFFGNEHNNASYRRFTEMYGRKNSKALEDATNAMAIANHMNKELMTK